MQGLLIVCFDQSDLARDILGEHVFESFLHNKRLEWDEYLAQVTDFERERYLPVL